MTDPTLIEQVTLAECPIGLFWSDFGTLCLKTEYGNNEGRVDAYIIESGEFFWGRAPQTIASQRASLVTPIDTDDAIATLQGSAALPSEAMIEAGVEASLAAFHNGRMSEVETVISIYTAMRATTPTAPDNMGPQGEDHPFNPANDPDAPVQDDDAELIERIDQRIAEHRAHLAALQAKYGRGVVPDERNAGLVIGFGDLLDLRSRLSPTPETGLVEALTPREMSDEAKTGATVLVYFKRHGWLSVEWNNRFIDYGEPITPENGIWCVNDHKNEVWHLRGYNEGDDTHWMPLPKPPALSNVLPDEV